MPESNTGLQTKKSTSSLMLMRSHLKSATREALTLCSDGRCSRFTRTLREKRLPPSRMLTPTKLLRSHSPTATSTQLQSHTPNLSKLVSLITLVWLMSTHTLFNTPDLRISLPSVTASKERLQELKTLLTPNAQ